MDREQAFIHLGLYIGAAREHIEDKYRRKREDLLAHPDSAARRAELTQLDEALHAALARPAAVPDTAPLASTAAPAVQPRRRLFKGWMILLAVFAALGVYTIVTFAVGDALDTSLKDRDTDGRVQASRETRQAWEKYRVAAGLAPAIEADQAFARAEAATEAEEAQREYASAEALYAAAFAAESRRLLDRLDAQFRQPWLSDVQPHFPFTPDAETEAPPAMVQRLLGPGGAFWQIDAELRRLAEVEVAGRVMAPLPAEHMRVHDAMVLLREMLFDDGAMQAKFAIRLVSNNRFRGLVLEVGEQVVRSGGETYTPVTWRAGKGKVRVTLGSESARDPALRIDESDSEWGLLRLLWRFELVQSEGGLLVWEFDQDSTARAPVGRKPRKPPDPLVVQILADKQGHPFDLATFAPLRP